MPCGKTGWFGERKRHAEAARKRGSVTVRDFNKAFKTAVERGNYTLARKIQEQAIRKGYRISKISGKFVR
jgi:hypothetical protein